MSIKQVLFLLFLILVLGTVALAQSGPSPVQSKLLDLVNHERETRSLPKFQWDDHLAQSAAAHAKLVIQREELSHQFPGEAPLGERIGATGLRFNAAGENLAYAPTIEEVHTGLMNSPPHRANILDPKYNAVGFAIVPLNGELYVVQNFAHVLPAYSEDQFRDAVVAAFNQERRAAKLGKLEVQFGSHLRKAACDANPLPEVIIKSNPGASDVVVFTVSAPEKLPTQMKKAAADRILQRMNIGVCFRPGKEHGYASFSVVAVFYSGE